nr:unnamed protein product [Callosobruchus analis]
MRHVDALSRNPLPSTDQSTTVETVMRISEGDWLAVVQNKDKEIVKIKETLESDWDKHIDKVQLGINSTINSTIKTTPGEVLFGIKLNSKFERYINHVYEPAITDVTKLRQEVFERLEENRKRQDEYQNRNKRKTPEFKVGEKVLLKISNFTSDGTTNKLKEKFKGPFTVTRVMVKDRYEVKEDLGSERCSRSKRYVGVTAAENMKPFVARSDDIWQEFNSNRCNTYEAYVFEKVALLRNLRAHWDEADLVEIIIHSIMERDVRITACNQNHKKISDLISYLGSVPKRQSDELRSLKADKVSEAKEPPRKRFRESHEDDRRCKRPLTCYNCGKNGHIRKFCLEDKKGDETSKSALSARYFLKIE